MPEPRKFHIGDLIAIVVGNLVCPVTPENGRTHAIDGVYDILNFMSGEDLMTHALPRVSDECKPVLLAEHPWLAEITFPGMPDGFDDEWDEAERKLEFERGIRREYLELGELPKYTLGELLANWDEVKNAQRRDIAKSTAQKQWEDAIAIHDAARKIYHDKCNVFVLNWLETLYDQYREYHDVWPLHCDDHESIHPLDEPIIQGKNIIGVNLDSSDEPPLTHGEENEHTN